MMTLFLHVVVTSTESLCQHRAQVPVGAIQSALRYGASNPLDLPQVHDVVAGVELEHIAE
jgi:hypothetical protein